jgi:hypothetical protein
MASMVSRASDDSPRPAVHDRGDHHHLHAAHRERQHERAKGLVDLLRERLRVAHDGERRGENGAEEPAQHEAEPGEAPQVGEPALAEREEHHRGGQARRQRPFPADPRHDGRRHR